MQTNRALVIDENFVQRVHSNDLPLALSHTNLDESGLSSTQVVSIFESQVLSRCIDLEARVMQSKGLAFYTIGSSGHEGNAAIAAAFRPDDMAFLHYRDAAFLIQRSKQVPGQTMTWDMMLSFAASSDDPVAGGRHKVLGSKALMVPPQTSTIASHLPKAAGLAYSITLNKRFHNKGTVKPDSVSLCSFGDASLNHSTAQGAINTSCWISHKEIPLPLVWICEDNGIGISVKTPKGWVEASMSHRPGLKFIDCDGLSILDTYLKAKQAERFARTYKRPVFLRMRCVRLMGHAGSDAQQSYLSREEIESQEANDPLLHGARILLENNILSSDQIIELYKTTKERVAQVAQQASERPRYTQAKDIVASLIPPKRQPAKHEQPTQQQRERVFQRELAQMGQPQHTAKLLNWTLTDLMLTHPEIVLAGEDIGRKGGVYGVTQKLQQKFGSYRVIDTLLDEQSILGLSIGVAHNQLLPIVEIQFLAYVHNAEDQIRGEAATLSFFSDGQFTNPMVIRIAGLAYQKGFGGHFHNDNSFTVFRDIPGLLVACPSNGADAVVMLRESVRMAREEQRVVIFLEPIALYMTRDLSTEGDQQWTFDYPAQHESRSLTWGDVGVYEQHVKPEQNKTIAIITYANGYFLSRQAAETLAKDNVSLKIIDLRWLVPLPSESMIKAVADCQQVLVVDECRQSGSISEEVITALVESGRPSDQIARLTAEDSFIPLGKGATATLPSCEKIISKIKTLMENTSVPPQEISA